MKEALIEEKLLKRMAILAVGITLFFIMIAIGIDYRPENYYSDTMYLSMDPHFQPSDLSYEFDQPDIIEIKKIRKENQRLIMTLYGLKSGKATMTIRNQKTGKVLTTHDLQVTAFHQITNLDNGNFSSYQDHTLCIVLYLISIACLLLYGFRSCQRSMGYSYQAIFYSGFFLWICVLSITLFVMYLYGSDMIYVYQILQHGGYHFILCSFLAILLFAIAMTISNLSLIRHERFRFRNILGIVLSVCMVLGAAIAFIGYGALGYGFADPVLSLDGSPTLKDTLLTILSTYTSVYCLMECFFLGSVICGYLSATHEPAYDKDYLIILGCRVRKDGTLMPLIRSRVDRAIAFYEKQLQISGKQAIFLPSGGQGSDEQISEGDAMARYLLEQGYGKDQILVENRSRNTRENMLFSKALIDSVRPEARVAFSTNNFHVFRSGIISRQNDFYPDGMGCPTKWYFWPNAYIREMIGMITYLWKRLVLILIPIVLFFAVLQWVF